MDRQQTDDSGRTIYGADVHLDLFPLRYLAAVLALILIAQVAPTIVTVMLVLLLCSTAMYNLAALRCANYKQC